MKKTRIIGTILAVSMIVVMSSPLVASAVTYYTIMDPPGYVVNAKGTVWVLNSKNAIPSPFPADELKPETIVAKFYLTQFDLVGTTVEPTRVILTKTMIILFFDGASLPEDAFKTTVIGNGGTGETYFEFTATGPGFTYQSPGPN